MARALDLQSTGRGYKLQIILGASSIIWYRPKGGDAVAGKVSAGLAESSGSLPLGG